MRQDAPYDEDEDQFRGPSKSQLKRTQNELQDLGKEMTAFNDITLEKIGLPEDVLIEIKEYRRMRSFGAQRRQLQLIGKKMRDLDPVAVREAIDRATGTSKAAVALLHRCEVTRDRLIDSDDALTAFIKDNPEFDISELRTLIRNARRERENNKPPKSSRALYRLLHSHWEQPLDLYAKDEDEDEE